MKNIHHTKHTSPFDYDSYKGDHFTGPSFGTIVALVVGVLLLAVGLGAVSALI